MGRYRSDDSEEEYAKKSKKKRRRRSRSVDSQTSTRSRKSKKKHRRSSRERDRSRSRTPDRGRTTSGRSSRRSRSKSFERYGRKYSTSPSQRSSRRSSKSRSPSSRRRRSRSYSRSRRSSRSHSRGRRSSSRSPPPRRIGRRSRSYSHERRSRSADHSHSGRSSAERRRADGGAGSNSRGSPASFSIKELSLSDQSPGFENMTPAEKAEERMRLALKAAAAADEKLKLRAAVENSGASSPFSSLSSSAYDPVQAEKFANSVAAIESCNFVQTSFKSSRGAKLKDEPLEPLLSSHHHDSAIFGSLASTGFTIKPDPDTKPGQLDTDSIIHPSLFCDPQEKMDRWIDKLIQMRKRKLEGDLL